MDRQDQQENQPIQETSYNPELQNQADGKECKSLLKGKNLAILIAVALGFIIVNAIVTVAIVSCNKSEVKSNTEDRSVKDIEENFTRYRDKVGIRREMSARLSFNLVHENNAYLVRQYLENRETFQVPDGYMVMVSVESGDRENNIFIVKRDKEMDGKNISNAFVNMNQFGQREIVLNFNSQGAVDFANVTKKNIGRQLAIILDGKLYCAPVINSEITGGKAQITGNFSREDAENIAKTLVSGSVPKKMPKKFLKKTSDEKNGYEVDGTVVIKVDKGRKRIVIREGITGIAKGAFSDCSNLEQLAIPSSMRFIEPGEFSDCVGLKKFAFFSDRKISLRNFLPENYKGEIHIIIPNSVKSIGDFAFSDCSGLTSVTIPNNVTSIGKGAFNGCSGLTSVTIPNSVKSIGDLAFFGCSGLTSVTIPNSVKSIGAFAFEGCSGLTSVTIPKDCSVHDYAFRPGCRVIRR